MPGGRDPLGARTRYILRKVGEEVGIAGNPVRDDDQCRKQDLRWLRQFHRLPRRQALPYAELVRASVEQLLLHPLPQHPARPVRTQQMWVTVERLDLTVLGRHAVVPADRDRELPSLLDRPTVPLLQPLPQQHLPGQPVRCEPPIRAHRLLRAHIQPMATHDLRQLLYLAGEGGRRLPDVVHTGQPHHQPARIHFPTRQRAAISLRTDSGNHSSHNRPATAALSSICRHKGSHRSESRSCLAHTLNAGPPSRARSPTGVPPSPVMPDTYRM